MSLPKSNLVRNTLMLTKKINTVPGDFMLKKHRHYWEGRELSSKVPQRRFEGCATSSKASKRHFEGREKHSKAPQRLFEGSEASWKVSRWGFVVFCS